MLQNKRLPTTTPTKTNATKQELPTTTTKKNATKQVTTNKKLMLQNKSYQQQQ